MLFVDLETCFLRKGTPRKQQQILEIGMCYGKHTFQCMVNPLGDKPVIPELERLGQHPQRTINFWTKLLVGKKYLRKQQQTLTLQEKAEAIQSCLKDTNTFLSPLGGIRAAARFAAAFKNTTWVAHNGKSFDFHILRNHLQLANIPEPKMIDSLPLMRKAIDLPSHTQPLIYKHLFKETYKAHHALHDAQALQRIWKHVQQQQLDTLTHTLHTLKLQPTTESQTQKSQSSTLETPTP